MPMNSAARLWQYAGDEWFRGGCSALACGGAAATAHADHFGVTPLDACRPKAENDAILG